MILRFTVNLDVSFTNNTAELPARSVKVQQRTSGGSWRTLQGLIDFAVVQSYLSTATKWGLDAATEWLTAMHTGGRSKTDIDNGAILPKYAGTIVRDGYAGYTHLDDALHAWCGAHLLRDLAAYHRADPDQQVWAKAMADLLIDAHHHAQAARAAGEKHLDEQVLTDLRRRYLGAYTAGIRDNHNRCGPLAKDAAALARRFRDHQDMILRFVLDLAVPFTNNQAERDLRPVKIQQRTSGGTWRTLAGLADFAVVQSYLSTARKWGIDSHDALTRLFTTGAWLPPAAVPC